MLVDETYSPQSDRARLRARRTRLKREKEVQGLLNNCEAGPSTDTPRVCEVYQLLEGTMVVVRSALHPYQWTFTLRSHLQTKNWFVERTWIKNRKVYYREFIASGFGGWGTGTALLESVERNFEVEFGDVLQSSLALSVLRDILNHVGQFGSNWPEELGQGIFVHA